MVFFFALDPVVRVVALVRCLRVEFRHHFVSVRDTGAYRLTLLTSHQERLRDRGSTVVKVLCYKSEGRWFDPS